MLQDTIQRLSVHRANCKQWSTALAVVVLLAGALGHVEGAKLLWAAAPIVLLGLAEAGYAAHERRIAEHLKGRKASEQGSVMLPREAAGTSFGRIVVAVTALSIWPFYAGLAAIVVAGGGAVTDHDVDRIAGSGLAPGAMAARASHPAQAVVATAKSGSSGGGGCGSGGGCGAGGPGCGSGGCGAASGKACGCGGGGGTKPVAAKANGPQQPYLQTSNGPRPFASATPGPLGVRPAGIRPPTYSSPSQVGGGTGPVAGATSGPTSEAPRAVSRPPGVVQPGLMVPAVSVPGSAVMDQVGGGPTKTTVPIVPNAPDRPVVEAVAGGGGATRAPGAQPLPGVVPAAKGNAPSAAGF